MTKLLVLVACFVAIVGLAAYLQSWETSADHGCQEFSESGFVRQIWTSHKNESGYQITLERLEPKGELIPIRIVQSGQPTVWLGLKVKLRLAAFKSPGGICVDGAELLRGVTRLD